MKHVAHRLLRNHWMASWLVLALLTLGVCGCIAPLQFEEQHDGGVNDDNPPMIILSSAKPSMLGSADIDSMNPTKFSVQVEDQDTDDDLFLRVFRDYQQGGAHRQFVGDKKVGDPDMSSLTVRTFEIETNTWCDGITSSTPIIFEVLVTDRPWLEITVDPVYRAVPAGAKTARSYWVAVCH